MGVEWTNYPALLRDLHWTPKQDGLGTRVTHSLESSWLLGGTTRVVHAIYVFSS